MKEQELSSIFIYLNGNSRYYLKSESIARRQKKTALSTIQRMAFISVEDLKIERVASGSNTD
jgi:hypothetical protein